MPNKIFSSYIFSSQVHLEVLANLLQVEVADAAAGVVVVVLEALEELGDEGDILLADLLHLLRHLAPLLLQDLDVEPAEESLVKWHKAFVQALCNFLVFAPVRLSFTKKR
jgi:hypothetical protein